MFKQLFAHQQITIALIIRLSIVYLLFQVSRLVFFIFNASLFPQVDTLLLLKLMTAGLLFDTSAIFYTNSLFILSQVVPIKVKYKSTYQFATGVLFILTNTLILAANMADVIYYRFTLRRTTADVFDEFMNQEKSLKFLLKFCVDYWPATLVLLFLIAFLIWMYSFIKVNPLPNKTKNRTFYGISTTTMLLTSVILVYGMRGNIDSQTSPITISNAGKYTQSPKQIALVLNTPFAIFRTLGKKAFVRVNTFPDNEAAKYFSPLHQPADSLPAFKPMNIVVLILESFSREYVGFYNRNRTNYAGFTPFLDSLLKQSYTWSYGIANGRKSIDAMPSIMASIPRTTLPYILSPYAQNDIKSLVHCLSEKGYSSAFFHGAPNGSMGFDSFAKLAGFDNYYGQTEYGNDADYDGFWGIWDHKFLPYTAHKMSQLKPPFIASVFSLSSHHPFSIPTQFKGKLRQGELPIHQCVHYTDFALREFFNQAQQQPWFRNTLFVISADHASTPYFPEYKTELGNFAIPIAFYIPSDSLHGYDEGLAQQIDIMPSVLGYLNYDKPFLAFGDNLFKQKGKEHYTINFNNNVFQYMQGEHILLHDGKQVLSVYNYRTDSLMHQNIKGQLPELELKASQVIKAYNQQYTNRLIDNKLQYKAE